ncbi:1-phosphatidylinositol phosphodiesterase [Vanrija pseudolonga]|uniref:1-phosphatidylinositol phosphodiesterase n=1 Tax=Vanrija pseudolonga TaxID=143232 RepID=A0AAF0YAW5_9TREE|nr:1-phosphatidylinositol phosphodiesterase [Vanrija pseudolonga]
MPIRIIPTGGIEVRGASINGGDAQLQNDGNARVVDDQGQTVTVRFDRGGEGQFDVLQPSDAERQRGWARLDTQGNGSVIAYRVDDNVVLLPRPDLENWQSHLPDDRALADLSTPGTHESASLSGGFISICHTEDVRTQLQQGIRFLDIRLKVVNGELQTYHGIQPQNSNLREQIGWVNDFLRGHNREAVFVSIKQENDDNPDFGRLVEEAFKEGGLTRWDETLPTLGEARGKAILFSRYHKNEDSQYPNGMGIHPTTWPDNNEGFDWDCNGTPFRTQDVYDTGDIGTKTNILIRHIESTTDPRGNGLGNNHPFTLSFATAAKFPQSPPQWMASGSGSGMGVSKVLGNLTSLFGGGGGGGGDNGGGNAGPQGGVNSRLAYWLLQRAAEGKRPRATIMLDFYRETGGGDAGISELIAALNYINTNE